MTTRRKLIEVALPLEAISAASAHEKAVKSGHPANLHRWWARRPLAATRAVLFASLVDDPASRPDRFPTAELQAIERMRLLELVESLSLWSSTTNEQILEAARREIALCFPNRVPTLLDPFGGGGAIPLEGARLGLNVVSGDLNPVAVLIQRAMMLIPQTVLGRTPIHTRTSDLYSDSDGLRGFAEDFRHYAMRLSEISWSKVADNYKLSPKLNRDPKKVIAWVWARCIRSPDPAWPGTVPLVGSWVLATKGGTPRVWIEPQIDQSEKRINYRIVTKGKPSGGTISGGRGICIATGSTIDSQYIKNEFVSGRVSHALMAIAVETAQGREYLEAELEDEIQAGACAPKWKPEGRMSSHPQYMGTVRYGLDEWHKLFTPRQLTALTSLYDAIPIVREMVIRDFRRRARETHASANESEATSYADSIITYLVLALGKLSEISTSICRWEPIAQCPRTIFARQSVSMLMDYAEANPFGDSSGSFNVIVDGIYRVLNNGSLRVPKNEQIVLRQRDAVAQVSDLTDFFVSMDPPYYDNVPYADLSDFFYVWQRRALNTIWPDEYSTLLTPKLEELVADSVRFGDKSRAKSHFEKGMSNLFAVLRAKASETVPMTIFYAFQATEHESEGSASTGWESFLTSLIEAGFTISATWPIRTENLSRTRAQGSNALATSVVLVCRPRLVDAPMSTRGEIAELIREELIQSLQILQSQNIAPVDLAQSAIGPGMSVFSRFSRVVESDGSNMSVRSALILINSILSETLSGGESELDSETRFALTWYEQYGFKSGPFGDADVLARAKNTSIEQVVKAGLAVSRSGAVRLFQRHELNPHWNPQTDQHLTIWEIVHHILRALEESEAAAARIMRTLGPGLSERALQLCYLLFRTADVQRRSDESASYNMIVMAWPQLQRLAAQDQPGGKDGNLFS